MSKSSNSKSKDNKTTPIKKKVTTKKKEESLNSKAKSSEKVKNSKGVLDRALEYTTRIRIDRDRLNDTGTLDTSFLEKNKKAVNKKKIIVSEEKMRKDDEKRRKKEKKHSYLKDILLLLLFILILTLSFYMVDKYFISKCAEKPKVKNEKSEVERIILDDNYLFLGDFLTDDYDIEDAFKDMFVVKSAYKDDLVSDFLNNLTEKVYRYNPSKIFIEVGLNDVLEEKDDEEIVAKIEELVDRIKENRSYCEIYVESIYPINRDLDDDLFEDANEKSKKINEELFIMSEEKNIKYIDLYDILIDKDDNLDEDYTDDGKHLNDDGYEKVTEEIKKYINGEK